MERMDASLERTIRNAADYLTELDCIQQTVEVECDKIQRRLASMRQQELQVTSMLRGHRHYKYCMLYMAKLYADMALFLEQQYLADGGSPGGGEWRQIGRFFRSLYQVTLEVAFVYLKEAQVACGNSAVTPTGYRGRGDGRAMLISLSRQDQDAYFPLLWRLCSRPYDTFLGELTKNSNDDRRGLSRAITKINLVDDNAVASPVEYCNSGEKVGGPGSDPDNPIPVAFVAFIHHHIALLAPFFLKRRQRLVTQSPDHLPPHTYLQKALDIILETLQDALYTEMCAGQFHQKFLQSTDFLSEHEQSLFGRDMTSLVERYRKPVRSIKQFLADCNDAVNAHLNALYHKFSTQCSCSRLFHVCVE